MSVNAMTNVSMARRRDFGPIAGPPAGLSGMAIAAGGPPQVLKPPGAKDAGTGASGDGGGGGGDNSVHTALQTLTTYIPTEVLTLYVAAATAVGPAKDAAGADTGHGPEWLFWLFLVFTPAVVWAVFAAKVRTAKTDPPPDIPWRWGQLPVFDMIAATIAYAVWAFALPRSPFAEQSWYSTGLTSVAVLVISAVLALAAAIIVRRPLSD